MTLLLDRGRFGVALDDDQPAQHRAVFARHFLPGRLALMRAEADPAVLDRRREQNAPAVLRHSDIAEFGPALGLDTDRGAQIDEIGLETLGAALLPPLEAPRMPAFERPTQPRVGVEADIVRNEAVVIDEGRIDHVLLPVFGGATGIGAGLLTPKPPAVAEPPAFCRLYALTRTWFTLNRPQSQRKPMPIRGTA